MYTVQYDLSCVPSLARKMPTSVCPYFTNVSHSHRLHCRIYALFDSSSRAHRPTRPWVRIFDYFYSYSMSDLGIKSGSQPCRHSMLRQQYITSTCPIRYASPFATGKSICGRPFYANTLRCAPGVKDLKSCITDVQLPPRRPVDTQLGQDVLIPHVCHKYNDRVVVSALCIQLSALQCHKECWKRRNM